MGQQPEEKVPEEKVPGTFSSRYLFLLSEEFTR
jgi:hypothetical protein